MLLCIKGDRLKQPNEIDKFFFQDPLQYAFLVISFFYHLTALFDCFDLSLFHQAHLTLS